MVTEVNCPCYQGDGYTYTFDRIEFNLCAICHEKLFNQMVKQYKIEKECTIEVKKMEKRIRNKKTSDASSEDKE